MVFRTLLKSKIHRAVVTGTNIDYVGSLKVDQELIDAAGMVEFELVMVANIDNGVRLETYLISGEKGTGVIEANGAAAKLLTKGDRIIIMTFAQVEEPIPEDWMPDVVIVDENNKIATNQN